MVEAKVLPGNALNRKVKEKAVERIEQETGRKPGKKERKELKEEARLTLAHGTHESGCYVGLD